MKSEVLFIEGIKGYVDSTGVAYINLKNIADELGTIRHGAKSVDYGVFVDKVNSAYKTMFENTTNFKMVQKQNTETWREVCENEFIDESIFYYLALRSDSESAIRFQQKVCREILPVLRRTGMYTTEELDKAIANKSYDKNKRNWRVM